MSSSVAGLIGNPDVAAFHARQAVSHGVPIEIANLHEDLEGIVVEQAIRCDGGFRAAILPLPAVDGQIACPSFKQ